MDRLDPAYTLAPRRRRAGAARAGDAAGGDRPPASQARSLLLESGAPARRARPRERAVPEGPRADGGAARARSCARWASSRSTRRRSTRAASRASRASSRRARRGPSCVAGMETHICVFQTARELVRRGMQVHVVADAVASRREENRALGPRAVRARGGRRHASRDGGVRLARPRGDRGVQGDLEARSLTLSAATSRHGSSGPCHA